MPMLNDSTVEGQVTARRSALHDGSYVTSLVVPCHPSLVLQRDIAQLPDLMQLQRGEGEGDQPYQVMGRLLQVNDLGRMLFAFIRSDGVDLQLCATASEPVSLAALRAANLGDHVWAVGHPFRTRQGKRAVLAIEARTVTPCIRPLPGKALQGLGAGTDAQWCSANPEADLVMRPAAVQILRRRAAIVRSIRSTLDCRGFVEVETRTMMRRASGASATPFTAYHRHLGTDVHLRIATEVELKRLVVGGLEQVYELGRVYRNEASDRTHSPEFTTVEMYHAGIDLPCMMMLVEDIVQDANAAVNLDEGVLPWGEHRLDVGSRSPGSQRWCYERVTMRDAVAHRRHVLPVGLPIEIGDPMICATERTALPTYVRDRLGAPAGACLSYGTALQWTFDEHVVPHIIQPMFITEHPLELSPLSARSAHDPMLADRFELYACGMEIANGCTELTDPDEQRRRMETQGAVDHDLIRALELGMPPTAGCGIGVDRLCMLLLGATSIDQVMALPL